MFSPHKQVIADLHVHSPYSRAVSPRMTLKGLRHLSLWKGINLVAAGDWTHPVWLAKLKQELEEVRPGVFRLKAEYRQDDTNPIIVSDPVEPEFLLATEVSCIFSQGGKLRRVHLLVWVPSFAAADKVITALLKRGAKLASDGRPVLGISCRDLTALVLEADPASLVIPAHAWTPWFGVLGSKGGFDSLEAAFQDLTPYIYALETGLSSDPAMNWRVPDLDKVSIVSFGDAHSLPKVGRELTVFEKTGKEYEYQDLWQALAVPKTGKKPRHLKLDHTIEFYPEEGKYHWDGHRACNLVQPPSVTREKGVICPVCGKPLTVGVEYRVDEPADPERLTRPIIKESVQKTGVIVKDDVLSPKRPSYISLVPLLEIIAEVLEKSPNSQVVNKTYVNLLNSVGNEFEILLNLPLEKIAQVSTSQLAQAVGQVRAGKLSIEPGYDGVYGTVTIEKTKITKTTQDSLF